MLNWIAKPFGMLLMWLYQVLNSYGLALLAFALIVRLIMLPFMMKSKKGSLRMARMTPLLNDIQKRYAGNQQKINEETQRLYREENVNPMSGCLWSLIPFPILIALYQAIRYPITVMMGVAKEALAEGGVLTEKLASLGFEAVTGRSAAYSQIFQAEFIHEHWSAFANLGVEKLRDVDFSFLGIDLGKVPGFGFITSGEFTWANIGLFLIPVIAALLTWVSTKVASAGTPQAGQQQQQMNTMNMMMPLMTLVFAFMMPSSMGLYWAAGSLFSCVQDVLLNKHFNKVLDAEDAVNIERRRAREAELEAKRQETERLRAEGNTEQNPNTSKRKQQQKDLQARAERAQEYERRKAAQRGEDLENEASREGDRRYARGRAYDPDRYTRKELETGMEPPADDGQDE